MSQANRTHAPPYPCGGGESGGPLPPQSQNAPNDAHSLPLHLSQPAAKAPLAAKVAAAFAATVLVATPVFAADADVKAAVCARTPTAKMCLRDSAKN